MGVPGFDQDFLFIVRRLIKKGAKGLPFVSFPDTIGFIGSKPALYMWIKDDTIMSQKNKEKLAFTEMGKALLEREKEVIDLEKSLGTYKEGINYNYWRIVYKEGIVESINLPRLLYNFSKSRIGKFAKEVHYVVRDVPKEEPCLENFIK